MSGNVPLREAAQTPDDPTRWGFALIATGIPLLATGGFLMLVGIVVMVMVWVSVQRVIVDCCSPFPVLLGAGLAIAGGICLYLGRMHRAEGRKLGDAASLLKAHRRMRIYDLAGKMRISEADAEAVVARCLSLGLLEGYVDRRQNEFFTREAILHTRQISDCPQCHASIDQLRFLGEELRCGACGAIL
ncbi:MAG: hypothetical protein RIC55_25200 [Pirellulaceae bacterium]